MTKIICIYHGNCADGFTAAWCVRNYYASIGELDYVEFFAGYYDRSAPNVTDKNVILVDFSYKLSVMKELAAQAKSILILDHHKSAFEDLNEWASSLKEAPNVFPHFNMDKSGARITWDFYDIEKAVYEGEITPPAIVQYVEDRDLWRFNLSCSREINAAIFSYDYTFENWDTLNDLMKSQRGLEELAAEGRGIERKHFKDINELFPVVTHNVVIGGIECRAANLPYVYSSDAAHILAKQHSSGMGACFWVKPDGWQFSLRSIDSGPDVSLIAKRYGGGGHARAAGFTVDGKTVGDFGL